MDDDVLNAGTKLKWTKEVATIEEIEADYGFPQIVKATAETSTEYNLPEDESLLLVSKRNPIRLVAQTIEEGHYVMGKQIAIPSEYNGLFKLFSDFDREESTLQTFRSIQEVADAFPPRVYVQEQLTVTLSADESSGKFSTIVLEKGDELTIINRMESQASQGNIYKPASRFISRVRRLQHNFLVVHCNRLDESLSLPMSIQGWFATRPPLFAQLLERKGIISLQQLMEQADFPLTVSVSTNSTRSVKDEFILRTGMHLKLLGVEEHDLVLAIAPFQKIVEFASTGVTFKLPAVLTQSLDGVSDQVAAKNQYQTFVQNAYLKSKLQNSPSNIEEYCTSVRFHISRNRNPTKPKALDSNAYLRKLSLNLEQIRRTPVHNQGISAIQLLSSQAAENQMQRDRRSSSRRSNSPRRQLPTFETSLGNSAANPPLPPRNSTPSSTFLGNTEFAPPVPPKHRPPPPPEFDPPSLSSVMTPGETLSTLLDLPSRPPLPAIPNSSNAVNYGEDINCIDDGGEENIFEEFYPRNLPQQQVVNKDPRAPSAEQDDLMAFDGHQTYQSSSSDSSSMASATMILPSNSRSESPCFVLSSGGNGDRQNSVFTGNYENIQFKMSKVNHKSFDDLDYEAANEDPKLDVSGRKSIEPVQLSTRQTSLECLNGKENFTSSRRASHQMNGVKYDVSNTNATVVQGETSFEIPFCQHAGSDEMMPGTWTPPSDVTAMNIDEVANALRYIGISESAVQLFSVEKIDGFMLSELTDEILEEDFKLKKLHRFKIRRFVQGWRPKLPHV